MEHRKPTWAKKVPPYKIKKLYEQDAKGIYDEELVDDVGIGLYARVDSMLMVTSSNLGHPLCKWLDKFNRKKKLMKAI